VVKQFFLSPSGGACFFARHAIHHSRALLGSPEIINDLIGSGGDPGFSRRAGAPLKRRDASSAAASSRSIEGRNEGRSRCDIKPSVGLVVSFALRDKCPSPDAGEGRSGKLAENTASRDFYAQVLAHLSAPNIIPIFGIVVGISLYLCLYCPRVPRVQVAQAR